jgi:hypothetical protein
MTISCDTTLITGEEIMAIISLSTETDPSYWQTCRCCGRHIRLLADQPSLALFLEAKSLQRRGFQCMNCKEVICKACRENGSTCVCGCNAWIARPYLDLSVVRAI